MSAPIVHLIADPLDPVTVCCDRAVEDVTAAGDRIHLTLDGVTCPGALDLIGPRVDTATRDHHGAAVAHLQAVEAMHDHLSALYAQGPAASRTEIAAAHESIRHGLRIADLHAALALSCQPGCRFHAGGDRG